MWLMNEASLKVGEVAAQAGVGVQTLHYYERLGLLPKPKRSAGNYRLYSPDAVRRVRFIKKAQALGLNLQEIKEVLELAVVDEDALRSVALPFDPHHRGWMQLIFMKLHASLLHTAVVVVTHDAFAELNRLRVHPRIPPAGMFDRPVDDLLR